MRLRILAIMASTALVPIVALSQAPAQAPTPAQTGPHTQAPRAQTAPVTAAEFVNKATNSSLFEIQSSQLAQQKSQNNRVREFAQKMVQDHTAAADRLRRPLRARLFRRAWIHSTQQCFSSSKVPHERTSIDVMFNTS
jgi:predicted outer membrane protein